MLNLSKVYYSGQEKVYALSKVSFDILKGEFVVIVGPSGAGKSTLLHLLGGLDYPSEGKVFFNNEDIFSFSEANLIRWRRKRIGFIFQFYHLIEELNVRENILLANFSHSRKNSWKRAKELIQYFHLEDREEFFPSQLSGGEKQRVAIARALINEPEVLLCDEPTGSLDKDCKDEVIALLRNIKHQRGVTIILVTHNIDITSVADKVFYIKEGKVKENEGLY